MTPLPPAAMKWRKGLRAALGVVLCIIGFVLAHATTYRETTVIIDAGGCRLVTDVIDQGNDDARGFVVLLHGLAANKRIMSYLARGFADQNLRVFVPDLPGHGRTPGPFSFERAESCAESMVRELIAHRAIDPRRTMLAGHSMGGAIAIRAAALVGVAGVIAISPAPMRAARGVPVDMLPYTNPPPLPPHTLAIRAAGSRGCFFSRRGAPAILESAFVCPAVQRILFRELRADRRPRVAAGTSQVGSRVVAGKNQHRPAGIAGWIRSPFAGHRLDGFHVHGGLAYLGTLGAFPIPVCGSACVSASRGIIARAGRRTQQRGAHLAGLGAAPDRVSCARLWDLRPSQRSHPADPPLDIPRALFHLPASRDGSCTQTNRISNGRSRLRCYTPRWFLPGDLPRHLNRLLGRKGPFACKFARRERCEPSSYQKHDRDCNCRWRAIGSDVWRAVGASRPHRYYF